MVEVLNVIPWPNIVMEASGIDSGWSAKKEPPFLQTSKALQRWLDTTRRRC
jgi:hypothetical protein